MILYGHPFSSYTWKALIAFYETGTPVELRVVDPGTEAAAEWERLWPLRARPYRPLFPLRRPDRD